MPRLTRSMDTLLDRRHVKEPLRTCLHIRCQPLSLDTLRARENFNRPRRDAAPGHTLPQSGRRNPKLAATRRGQEAAGVVTRRKRATVRRASWAARGSRARTERHGDWLCRGFLGPRRAPEPGKRFGRPWRGRPSRAMVRRSRLSAAVQTGAVRTLSPGRHRGVAAALAQLHSPSGFFTRMWKWVS